MNNREMDDEDLLRKFLDPEKIERAPAGFTTKTLTRIRIETRSSVEHDGFFARNRVPVIFAVITAGLIIAAILIPAGDTGSLGSEVWKYFRDIKLTLPGLILPKWASYAMIGIFVMGFFDRALSGIFHKGKNP
jgi:hypothetical protein